MSEVADRLGLAPYDRGYDQGFEVTTSLPSAVVLNSIGRIVVGSNVLDLGCGQNLRNSLFLAHQRHCRVTAVDLQDPIFPQNLPDEIDGSINFRKTSVMEFDYPPGVYQTIVAARLIQYLPPECLVPFVANVSRTLTQRGLLLLSYTEQGGILARQNEYEIAAFSHPVELVSQLILEQGFAIDFLQQGANQSTNVPHAGQPAVTYDLVATKL